MRLVDLTCSKCNAVLQENPEFKKCICQYCGNEMLIDDEIQKRQVEFTNAFEFGYQQEMGRQKAIEDYKKQKQLEQQSEHDIHYSISSEAPPQTYQHLYQPKDQMLAEYIRIEAERIQKENKRFEAMGLGLSILGLIPFVAVFFVMQIGSFLVCVKLYQDRKKYKMNSFVVILTFILTIIDAVMAIVMLRSMV